jgi:sugar phosphate isomerase/epimerase
MASRKIPTNALEVIAMKLGCSTALFNQLDLYGALQHITWAGYDGAELACLGNLVRHIELNTTKCYINEVKSIAKKHRLELFAIHTDVGGLPGEDKIKSMTKMFDVALKLSIPIVTMHPGGRSGDLETTIQEFEYTRKLSEQAERRGITLAVKAHAGASVYNTATLLQLLAEVDSPALGVTFDPTHFCRAGEDPSEAVFKIGKKIVHVHLRDYSHFEQSMATPEQQIPGRGEIDFLRILRRLKDVGYDKAVDTLNIGAFTYPLSKQMGIAGEARGYISRCLHELK